jgi:hypothetical protein
MGTCQGRVTLSDNSRTAIVTFTETWLTRNFSTPFDNPGGPISHHSWRFEVRRDARTGPWRSVVSIGGYGDFPPQGQALHCRRRSSVESTGSRRRKSARFVLCY